MPRMYAFGDLPFAIDFFFSSRRRHTRYWRDWSSDVCSSDLSSALRRLCCVKISEPSSGQRIPSRSEERRVGKSVDLGGRRIIKKKTKRLLPAETSVACVGVQTQEQCLEVRPRYGLERDHGVS